MKYTLKTLTIGIAIALACASLQAATTTVTGGNAADVVTALAGSSPGDIIQIGDNLTYDFSAQVNAGVTLVSSRTLRAAPGFTPTVTANPSSRTGRPIFRLSGTSLNTGVIQGLRFVSGASGNLISYIDDTTSANISILKNEFTLQNLDNILSGGRAIDLIGTAVRGPTILLEGNLFRTTTVSGSIAQIAVRTDGGAGGFIARNNILDMAGRAIGTAFGFFLTNEGGTSDTTIINNTLLFATSASAVGVNLGTFNPMISGSIQNNIFLNADFAYQDQNTSGSSTLTLAYNLFDNVGSPYSAQAGDTITTNNNINGVGIASLDGFYVPQTGSLAIDNGRNGLNYGAVDFYGDQRVFNGTVDIGAVEVPEPTAAVFVALAAVAVLVRKRRIS